MNPKIEKLRTEIEKTKAKIASLQEKVREMERQKTELENTDIVAVTRSYCLTPEELAQFLKAHVAPRVRHQPSEEQEARDAE